MKNTWGAEHEVMMRGEADTSVAGWPITYHLETTMAVSLHTGPDLVLQPL